MKQILMGMISILAISSVSSAQVQGGLERERGGGNGLKQDRREERREDRREERRENRKDEREEVRGGIKNEDRGGGDNTNRDRDRQDDRGRAPRGSSKEFAGAIGPGNFCTTCAFENRTDTPLTGSKKAMDRFLVNSDRDSIDARCRELGYDYGQALQWYSRAEWCTYSNAKTRTYDRFSRRWIFGRCVDGNVKLARCFRD